MLASVFVSPLIEHHLPSLGSLFRKNVRAHASPGPLDYLWKAVTNRECLALDPPCSSRLLCVPVHGFPKLAGQDLSASVSRTHACHFESSLDLLMLRFHQKMLTDPLVLMWRPSCCWKMMIILEQREKHNSPLYKLKCLPILGQCRVSPFFHSYEHPRSEQSLPSDRTAGVSSSNCTVTNWSRSWTYTCASSSVCTSPFAVTTVVGVLDLRKVSISSELESFLLSMCLEAPESTTHIRSSVLLETCTSASISTREENVALSSALSSCIFLAKFHATLLSQSAAFNRNSSSFRRIEIIDSESWDTQPWTFSQNSNCSLSTFFSRPRAEVTSHQQHVDIGNACNKKNICFQTCNHDTRDDADKHTTIFFILSTTDKDFNSSRKTGLQTVWVFHVSLFLHFLYWKKHLFWMRISCVSSLHSTLSSRSPVACGCRKLQASLLERDQLSSTENILQSSARCKNFALSFYYEPMRKLLPALKFYSVREFLQMHLRVEITRNCHATWVQVQMPKARSAIDIRIFVVQTFFLALTEEQDGGVNCNGSSLSLVSVPSFLTIPNNVAKFLESLCNSSGFCRACWQSKLFPGKLMSSRVLRSIPILQPGFLELEVVRAWWGTQAL